MVRTTRIFLVSLSLLATLSALGTTQSRAQECTETFDSTYDLIQKAIFENKGCASATCHGAAAAGGLDLSAGASYDNLIEAPATSVPDGVVSGLKRVVPGQKDQSLLFLNLAAGTAPEQWQAPLRAMPIGLEALSTDELEAVREWIEQGAPREGTVPGTGELLDACLPPAKPIAIEPLPVPDPQDGVQIRMPQWSLPANSEDEACFASYYDVSETIPERYLTQGGASFAFRTNQVRQDPLSHHLIVYYYFGGAALDDATWGEFLCRGGDKHGASCEVTDLDFCGEGICGSEPVSTIACNGFGPANFRQTSTVFTGTQEASTLIAYPDGVFNELPVRGFVVWNSHAFNLTDEQGDLRAWLNFEFAEPEDRSFNARGINNDSDIFKMNVPPFAAEETCTHHVFPPNTRMYELNSHNHKRGKRFRVFSGRYACDGGPNRGDPCSPIPEESLEVPDLCPEAQCVRFVPPALGDCNGDAEVGIGDLTTCVNIALGRRQIGSCRPGDPNGDGSISVAELVAAVRAALSGSDVDDREPEVLFVNLVYNDPTPVRFDPPRAYPGAEASAAERSLTFCALFDNGSVDPLEVKTQSGSPDTPFGSNPDVIGGKCRVPTGCTEGRVGEPCSGNSEAQRDASCDSSPGAGDGFCDACQLRGGVTTEDEMYILNGWYYVEP